MLKFDAEIVKLLEDAYQGGDVRLRRKASFDALDPKPGDHILDLGCGNGLLTLDLARAVGPDGKVTGLDPSADMLEAARLRCEGRPNVALRDGDANQLPFEDAVFDKAVSLQVFEYFDDPEPPLDQAIRILRPGGRLVIGDIHWDSLIWHSDDPERMQRIVSIWDDHLARRRLPQTLPALMRDRGLTDVTLTPLTFCDIDLRPDGLAQMMIHLMSAFARDNGLVPEEMIRDWRAEQHDLARQGRFFFSLTHFVCAGRTARQTG